MIENIIKSIQNSAEGWKMFFFGGGMAPPQKTELGTALIGTGFSAAQQRFVGIKAGEVSVVSAEAQAPVGVRYIPASGGYDPGTPATVIERIQKSISESMEGWRMGYAHVAGKAKAGIEKSLAGWQWGISEAGSKVSESFGNVGDWFRNLGKGLSSLQWLLYVVVAVLIFVAIMVSIGYSGVGGPAARIAEKEHARRR